MKRDKEMEQAILDLIREYLCLNLIAEIEVLELYHEESIFDFTPTTPYGYTLRLGLPKLELGHLITLTREGSKEDFLEFIKNEFLTRHLEVIKFYSADLFIEPHDRC